MGIALSGQPTFALAPETVRGSTSWGGAARLSVRQRRGLLVELGLRIATRGTPDHRLWRNRLALTAGYGWRSGGFGVAAVIGPTVEPWSVRSDGTAQNPVPLGTGRATPLWGAAAAVTPAFHRQLTPSLRLRLGVRLDVATSVLGSGGAVRVLGYPPDAPLPEPLFGLGGLELSTGVELTLFIAPPSRSSTR